MLQLIKKLATVFALIAALAASNLIASPNKTSSQQKNATKEATFVYAIDGDTIIVKLNGRKNHVRLIGIDTPESRPNDKAERDSMRTKQDMHTIVSLGLSAARYTRSLLHPGDLLKLEYDVERRDKYDRILAYVYLPDGTMLNEKIIANGYAKLMTIPPNVHYVQRFEEALRRARVQKRGLWAN